MSGRIDSGIAKGLHENQFADLDPACRKRLLVLMARIAESTYRRGLQHGYLFAEKGQQMKIYPDRLRWGGFSLDSARMPICGTRMSSRERLDIQHGDILLTLGFAEVAERESP